MSLVITRTAEKVGRRLLDSLLPPRCLACGTVVADDGSLCPGCWTTIRFIDAPLCIQCGYPFELDFGEPVRCGACIANPPAFDRARAVFAYDDVSKKMIMEFKHGDRTDHAPGLTRWMARSGAELIADATVIAPIPLHKRRLFSRRYNQAALLANGLAKGVGVQVIPDLLQRVKNTPSQGRLSVSARRRNVQGAFRINPAHADALAGERILLVDDVMTTGATAESCAKLLRKAKAANVDLLTIARVARPSAS